MATQSQWRAASQQSTKASNSHLLVVQASKGPWKCLLSVWMFQPFLMLLQEWNAFMEKKAPPYPHIHVAGCRRSASRAQKATTMDDAARNTLTKSPDHFSDRDGTRRNGEGGGSR